MSPSLKDYETNDDFVNFFPGICILSKSNPALNTGTVYKLNRTGVSLELNYTTEDPTDDFDKPLCIKLKKTIIFLLNLIMIFLVLHLKQSF